MLDGARETTRWKGCSRLNSLPNPSVSMMDSAVGSSLGSEVAEGCGGCVSVGRGASVGLVVGSGEEVSVADGAAGAHAPSNRLNKNKNDKAIGTGFFCMDDDLRNSFKIVFRNSRVKWSVFGRAKPAQTHSLLIQVLNRNPLPFGQGRLFASISVQQAPTSLPRGIVETKDRGGRPGSSVKSRLSVETAN